MKLGLLVLSTTCAEKQPNEVSVNKQNVLHTATATRRQEAERSGAEATEGTLGGVGVVLVVVVTVASSGSIF